MSAPIPFAQALDKTRPFSFREDLLPQGVTPRRCGHLVYEYADSGEVVRVPNVWYNRTSHDNASAEENQIRLFQDDIERARKNLRLPDAHVANLIGRLGARIETHRRIAEEFRSKAAQESMGFYSCGNPLPDRVDFHRTKVAWLQFVASSSARAQTQGLSYQALIALESQELQSLSELQDAYYFDTSDVNSRLSCRSLGLCDFRDIAARQGWLIWAN